jgi:uncharacterized membrane protein YdbT with pleckstrin-like domain
MDNQTTPVLEEYTFRPNKNLFILYIITSILFMFIIIGFPMLIGVILWYKFTYITLGKQGIHMHKGWLNITDKQVPYEKVNTVESRQSLIDRMFGCGQLKIYTGNDIQGIAFMGIDKPQKVKQMIEERVNQSNTNASIAANQTQQPSAADELAKYAALKQSGVITEEEFEAKKKQLLS